MKSLHITLMVFCHVLLASVVFYFTSLAEASPLRPDHAHQKSAMAAVNMAHPTVVEPHKLEAMSKKVAEPKVVETKLWARSEFKPESKSEAKPEIKPEAKMAPKAGVKVASEQQVAAVSEHQSEHKVAVAKVEPKWAVVEPAKSELNPEVKSAAVKSEAKVEAKKDVTAVEPKLEKLAVAKEKAPKARSDVKEEPQSKLDMEPRKSEPSPMKSTANSEKAPQASALVADHNQPQPRINAQPVKEPAGPIVEPQVVRSVKPDMMQPVGRSPAAEAGMQVKPAPAGPVEAVQQSAPMPLAEVHQSSKATALPVVMGGLGPLHLLATTLCSYQPDKPVADEHLNQLYARRASVRKSLFEFMSLKFTNLEKLSSRLGYGLQVVPVSSSSDAKVSPVTPSHGWPVVGKCTAHDLKLMGEAAWCECQDGDCSRPTTSVAGSPVSPLAAPIDPMMAPIEKADKEPKASGQSVGEAPAVPMISGSRAGGARSIPESNMFLPSPEESSVISKLLYVGDIKEAPTVESTIYNLNLTQHQLATLEAHATSTQECRRNSLRYTKALFNHLAEDQRELSNSWPELYALISADDCARKRMIDIVNALSGFRTDTTSIRRDNLEFAFAMDDLRAKVLESEVNVPLSFDRHFIEVEQFLQQSVRLMLANVQPKRAKLTSLRYRSLMYGAGQQGADDQCIDLHQRLLARNYPNDCNPTQFGQLPDVLRMTASSLELWSIEKELSLYLAKSDYPNSYGQKLKEDVSECIANLVAG